MKTTLPLFLLLTSCVTLSHQFSQQYGETWDGDTVCQPVVSGNVNIGVRLRPGAFQDCVKARSMVSTALTVYPLDTPWTAIFSAAEAAGWDFDYSSAGDFLGRQGSVHYYAGMTYTKTRVIALSGNSSDVLEHEFGHAWDTEHGLPNLRDHGRHP